jgi:nonsense-mediated mRNA decay protein 3
MVCDLLDPLFTPKVPATYEIQILDEPERPATRMKRVRVRVVANTEQFSFQQEEVKTIPITPILCEQCKRTSGGYYEALLQIRASTGKLSKQQESLVLSFIDEKLTTSPRAHMPLKVSPTRGGIDIKFLSSRLCRSLAKALATEFGLLVGVSSKVTGRTRSGKTQSRESFVVRFPPFKVGDVIAHNNQIYRITGIHNGRYILINLESEQRRVFSPKELVSIDWELLNDQIHDFMIISIDRDTIQLMSQQDYSIYDLPTPSFQVEVGDTLSAVRWNDRLRILPAGEG